MRKLCFALLILAGCTDSTGISLYIPFALFASDELSPTFTGVCGFVPITQPGGIVKTSGFLELDPNINPSPDYTLGLQVENYLDQSVVTDSSGNIIVGANRNDFNMNYAIVKYDDVDGNLTPQPNTAVYISGTVRTGGQQNSSAVAVEGVVGPVVAQTWIEDFQNKALINEQVLLKIQIFGTLASGEKAQTGIFTYPIVLCWDCGGVNPAAAPGTAGACPNVPTQTTPVPTGHGPCCAPQDFTETCTACGNQGQACCGSESGTTPCVLPLTCTGMQTSTTTELCPYLNQDFQICAKPST